MGLMPLGDSASCGQTCHSLHSDSKLKPQIAQVPFIQIEKCRISQGSISQGSTSQNYSQCFFNTHSNQQPNAIHWLSAFASILPEPCCPAMKHRIRMKQVIVVEVMKMVMKVVSLMTAQVPHAAVPLHWRWPTKWGIWTWTRFFPWILEMMLMNLNQLWMGRVTSASSKPSRNHAASNGANDILTLRWSCPSVLHFGAWANLVRTVCYLALRGKNIIVKMSFQKKIYTQKPKFQIPKPKTTKALEPSSELQPWHPSPWRSRWRIRYWIQQWQ